MKNRKINVELKIKKIHTETLFIVLVNVFFDKNFYNFFDAYAFMINIAIKKMKQILS